MKFVFILFLIALFIGLSYAMDLDWIKWFNEFIKKKGEKKNKKENN